jgi:hypothetical protein
MDDLEAILSAHADKQAAKRKKLAADREASAQIMAQLVLYENLRNSVSAYLYHGGTNGTVLKELNAIRDAGILDGLKNLDDKAVSVEGLVLARALASGKLTKKHIEQKDLLLELQAVIGEIVEPTISLEVRCKPASKLEKESQKRPAAKRRNPNKGRNEWLITQKGSTGQLARRLRTIIDTEHSDWKLIGPKQIGAILRNHRAETA